MTSKHYIEDRQAREDRIKELGRGFRVDSFTVDRGHKNGPENHVILSNGVINIFNARTHKLVTKLIARPAQIKRYYRNKPVPEGLIEKAIENTKKGLNR